jgi:hypothetical protein
VKFRTVAAVLAGLLVGAVAGTGLTAARAEAAGTTYYFSTSGSDAGDCLTTAAPCRTLAKASSLLVHPGDTVLLHRGDAWAHQGITVSASGTAADPLTVGAYGDTALGLPEITGGVQTSGKTGACIRVEGDHVVVDGIRTGDTSLGAGSCSQSTGFPYGYGVNALGSHITIRNSQSVGNGANYRLAGDHDVVTSSVSEYAKEYVDTSTTAGDDSGSFGVLVNGDDAHVSWMTFGGNRDTSFDYGYDGSDVELYNASNAMVDHNIDLGGSNGFSESGHDSTHTTSGNTFRYNVFLNVGSTAADAEAHGFTLRGAASRYGPNDDATIEHNVVVVRYTGTGAADTTQAVGCSATCPATTRIEDNILVASHRALYDDNAAAVVQDNILQGAVDGGVSLDSTNELIHPQLVSTTAAHLRTGAFAIDLEAVVAAYVDAYGLSTPQDGRTLGRQPVDDPTCG